ncbi:MAG: hypothetical protein V1929_08430 [bacterium]
MDEVMQVVDQFKNASIDIVYMLLQNPDSQTQFNIYAIVSFLACRWAFIRVVHAMNLNELSFLMYFVTTALGLAAIVLSLAAVKIYIPEWLESGDSLFYIIGIIIVSSMVLSVPIITGFTSENYFKTVVAWSASVLAIVGVMMIATVLADAFFEGKAAFDKGQKRNEETRQVIGK